MTTSRLLDVGTIWAENNIRSFVPFHDRWTIENSTEKFLHIAHCAVSIHSDEKFNCLLVTCMVSIQTNVNKKKKIVAQNSIKSNGWLHSNFENTFQTTHLSIKQLWLSLVAFNIWEQWVFSMYAFESFWDCYLLTHMQRIWHLLNWF